MNRTTATISAPAATRAGTRRDCIWERSSQGEPAQPRGRPRGGGVVRAPLGAPGSGDDSSAWRGAAGSGGRHRRGPRQPNVGGPTAGSRHRLPRPSDAPGPRYQRDHPSRASDDESDARAEEGRKGDGPPAAAAEYAIQPARMTAGEDALEKLLRGVDSDQRRG